MSGPAAAGGAGAELAGTRLDLPVSGMTCAACAMRIEKKLNKLDGVSASVNYATEKASVTFDPERVEPTALISTIEAAGYGAIAPRAGERLASPRAQRVEQPDRVVGRLTRPPGRPLHAAGIDRSRRGTGSRDLQQRLIGSLSCSRCR
ncbi:MAG: cation transporter [Ilumatobacteraceae bacterium]